MYMRILRIVRRHMAVQKLNPKDSKVGAEGVPNRGITLRAIVIGFLVIIPGVFWGVYGEVVSITDLTSTSLMMPKP